MVVTIFVDNDQQHIDDVKHAIPDAHTIKIPELYDYNGEMIDGDTYRRFYRTDEFYNEYAKRVSPNNSYHWIIKGQPASQRLDQPNEGMTDQHFDEIEAVITYHRDVHHETQFLVFLDFDRTLTQSEGFFLLNDNERKHYINYFTHQFFKSLNIQYPHKELDDMADFLYGPTRRYGIRDRIHHLRELGAEIYVITANTSCRNSHIESNQFVKLGNKAFEIDRNHVICSSDYLENKGYAIKSIIGQRSNAVYSFAKKIRKNRARKSPRKNKSPRKSRVRKSPRKNAKSPRRKK